MKELFFEHFWTLLVLSIFLTGVVAVFYRIRKIAFWNRLTRILLCLFLFLFALNLIVKTDRESIRACLDKLVQTFQEGSLKSFESLIAESFDENGVTREDLIRGAERILKKYRIRVLKTVKQEIDPPGCSLTYVIQIRLHPSKESMGFVKLSWDLGFFHHSSGWQLQTAHLTRVNDRRVRPLSKWIDGDF